MANPPATVSNPQADDAAAKSRHGQWYAFKGIGRAYLIRTGSQAYKNGEPAKVHGYPTIELALSNPNIIDPLSQAVITSWDAQASLPAGGGTLGVIETVNVTWSGGTATSSTPQNPTTAAAGNAIPGLTQIGDAFGTLTQANTWIRAAKILAGGALLVIGIAHMTGATDAVSTAARKVPVPI